MSSSESLLSGLPSLTLRREEHAFSDETRVLWLTLTEKSFMAYIATLGSRESHDSRLTANTLRARGPRTTVFTSRTLHTQHNTAVTQRTNTPTALKHMCVCVSLTVSLHMTVGSQGPYIVVYFSETSHVTVLMYRAHSGLYRDIK